MMGRLPSIIALVAGLLVHTADGAEFDWQGEFAAVCGQSEKTMTMTVDELRSALDRCDRLKPAVEAMEEAPRKVYLKRLQMCRKLLDYMRETRLKEAGKQ